MSAHMNETGNSWTDRLAALMLGILMILFTVAFVWLLATSFTLLNELTAQ